MPRSPLRAATSGARLVPLVALAALALLAACAAGSAPVPTAAERGEIAAEVEGRLRRATDLRAGGDVVARMMSIYPDSGRVVSAAGGQVTTTRDSLAGAVAAFWADVGRNMRDAEWRWGPMEVDVLGRDAAVVTATYRIPHLTPAGQPHVVGGAWTAVFARRGAEWVVVQEHLSDAPGALSAAP